MLLRLLPFGWSIFPDTKFGSGNGSKLFRLNMFLWSMGRSLPRRFENSIEKCEERRKRTASEARRKASATRKRRAEAAAVGGQKEVQRARLGK